MAKFGGIIGYVNSQEVEPGLYVSTPTERPYRGDLIRSTIKRTPSSDSVGDELTLSNTVSIISDPYAKDHAHLIKYVRFIHPKISGVWSVTNVEINEPRLLLTLGGVYNGPTSGSSD